jgi:hypothetical protein
VRRLIGRYFTPVQKVIREVTAILAPEIARRREAMQSLGRDYPDKPVSVVVSIAYHDAHWSC